MSSCTIGRRVLPLLLLFVWLGAVPLFLYDVGEADEMAYTGRSTLSFLGLNKTINGQPTSGRLCDYQDGGCNWTIYFKVYHFIEAAFA